MFDGRPRGFSKDREKGLYDQKRRNFGRSARSPGRMNARYWKEFEDMGDARDKRSVSKETSPRFPKEDRRRRKRSRSSSSSSSASSSHSSSSSSRRQSDSRSGYRDRERYSRKSPTRGTGRSNSYGSASHDEGSAGWFPAPHQQYPPQSQEPPPSSSYPIPPNQYPQGPPPPVQGQYPPNFQGQNFGNSYHSFGGYEPPPPNYYPANFPGTQPPHTFSMGGGQGPPPGNWEMFPEPILQAPIIQRPVSEGLPGARIPVPDKKAEEAAKKEAIEQELLQQKRTLAKQREDYVRRKFSLGRELSRLKDQKRDLMKEKSKENERILRENAKLQGEIQQKLKSIDNVIEMLTNIIGDSTRLPDIIKEIKHMEKEKGEEKVKKSEKKKHSPERGESRRRSESAEEDEPDSGEKGHSGKNFIYYDPGLHWCADCNVFPKTVTDHLDHLHSEEHKLNAKLKFEDFPWHNNLDLDEKSPQLSNDLPPKRIPIRGVQFLVPASAWFCSMCKVWLGDSHCAMKHVQGTPHSQLYNEFISKHPHWEVDWLTERTRSYEKKSEARQQSQSTVPIPPTSTLPVTIDSLSNQLLAMIANSKAQEHPPPPPPPPPLTKSSSSSDDEGSPDRRMKKKRKKSKRKRSKDGRSPSKEKTDIPSEQIKFSYKTMPNKKVDSIPVNDNFISQWMPSVDKRELVPIKRKSREDDSRLSKKTRSRGDSREPSSEMEKKSSPDDHTFDDHDEAVIFDKKPYSERESRSKKKYEEDSKYDRHSKYEKGSPKDKYKYKDKYRNEKDEDYKGKKDSKHQKDYERDRVRKSPFSRIKDNIEKKKIKNKVEKTSDDDVHETAFEKRSSESAAKKKDGKKLVMTSIPKIKLPFIGRMPILKKKVEQKSDDKEGAKKDNSEDDGMRDTSDITASVDSVVESVTDANIEELPKSTLIISKRPRLAEPGIVRKEILFNKPANDNLTEQDMELDEESSVLVKEEEQSKDELHKDFKDALDLLFPEEKKKDENEDSSVVKGESEVKIEDQQESTIAVAATGYMIPPGYDVNMYPPYYDQQAFVHQQWAQMGYDQTGQYTGPYSYPPPTIPTVEVSSQPAAVPEPVPVPAVEQKKKKNPPSQRKRRHMMRKIAKEAAEKNAKDSVEEGTDGLTAEEEETTVEETQEGEDASPSLTTVESPKPSASADMSDLALLGIDEDDAAAMGFY